MVCKPKFILTLSIYHHIQLVTKTAKKTKEKAHAEKQKTKCCWEVLLLCFVFSTKQIITLSQRFPRLASAVTGKVNGFSFSFSLRTSN